MKHFFAKRVVNVWIRPGFWVRGLVKITDLSAILNYYIPLPCFYALYFVLFIWDNYRLQIPVLLVDACRFCRSCVAVLVCFMANKTTITTIILQQCCRFVGLPQELWIPDTGSWIDFNTTETNIDGQRFRQLDTSLQSLQLHPDRPMDVNAGRRKNVVISALLASATAALFFMPYYYSSTGFDATSQWSVNEYSSLQHDVDASNRLSVSFHVNLTRFLVFLCLWCLHCLLF